MQNIHNNAAPSTMAFVPNVRGVGFSFFQSKRQHHISEMITTRDRFNNKRYMERIKEKIFLFNPRIIVLEEYRKTKGSVKTERIKKLIKDIADYACVKGIEVMFYTRHQIRDIFALYNVMTKFDIARLLCTWIPHLEYYMYKPRSAQRMEPYSSAVFIAVSLCVTYFYLDS